MILPQMCLDLVIPSHTQVYFEDTNLNSLSSLADVRKNKVCSPLQHISYIKLHRSSNCKCCNDTIIIQHGCIGRCSGSGHVYYSLQGSLDISVSNYFRRFSSVHIVISRTCLCPAKCCDLQECSIKFSRRISMCEQQQLVDSGVENFKVTVRHAQSNYTCIEQGTKMYTIFKLMNTSWTTAKLLCEANGSSLISLAENNDLKLMLNALQQDKWIHYNFGVLFIGLQRNKAVSFSTLNT